MSNQIIKSNPVPSRHVVLEQVINTFVIPHDAEITIQNRSSFTAVYQMIQRVFMGITKIRDFSFKRTTLVLVYFRNSLRVCLLSTSSLTTVGLLCLVECFMWSRLCQTNVSLLDIIIASLCILPVHKIKEKKFRWHHMLKLCTWVIQESMTKTRCASTQSNGDYCESFMDFP